MKNYITIQEGMNIREEEKVMWDLTETFQHLKREEGSWRRILHQEL